MKPIKAGLIGFGTGGEFFHAPFLNSMPEFELTAVFERTKEKSKEKYPNAQIVRTSKALFSNPEIELIVITTPNDTHFELAKDALNAGKNVVIDKPFVVSTIEADELMNIAKAKNKLLTVYHNRRFHSDFKTLQNIIKENKIGEISEFLACFDRYRPELRPHSWKETPSPGSGILYDLGSHLIDQALVLFGKPISISADLKMERQGANAIDNFEIQLHYKHHKAILKAGMLVEQPGPIFKLTGAKGSYLKNGQDPQENLLRQGNMPIVSEWAIEDEENWGTLNIDGQSLKEKPAYSDYRVFYRNVFDVIRNGALPLVQSEEAKEVIYIIEQALKSNVENNAKVSL
jgi:scyllo-inositol 2-dehydrogenase (NADP+)